MFEPDQPREVADQEIVEQQIVDQQTGEQDITDQPQQVPQAVTQTVAFTPDRPIIRALMPIVAFGLLVVFISLFLLLWPGNTATDHVTTTLHALRLIKPQDNGETPARWILDLCIYIVVLAGIWCLVQALRRGSRNALVGLMGVGVLGLAYAGGMALYTGPMVSVCGFSFILFGGMLAWVATSSDRIDEHENSGQDLHSDSDKDLGKDQQESELARRTGNNASHSVA